MSAEFDELIRRVLALGATNASIIEADKVPTDAAFRDVCASNSCGLYNKCWTCPPTCGEIGELINTIHSYQYVLVFQTVGALEDDFDFESMTAHGKKHNALTQNIRKLAAEFHLDSPLTLGAGGCHICPVCAKRTDEPCRHPDLALSSLEAHGVYVSKLAEAAGMKYINGENTVTYFGAVFFQKK